MEIFRIEQKLDEEESRELLRRQHLKDDSGKDLIHQSNTTLILISTDYDLGLAQGTVVTMPEFAQKPVIMG